ncbi:DUF1273 domain-containing protein [Lacticaseibacillus brantae]|uniref:UPF0398 protein FC34_GL000379 n=1 Tax=Lacticaseibacillus brantae DSM 23927 TaxID=1423727 RepID=A0A0R2AZF1_9LACO|nr:DUF1273 domain-containing protein [Lacticaseibacillus brantae]KRM72669.1 hypothetical protein FC34_GL000379 [Lacticaseibacillus brantae DSM 23927]
MLSRLWLTGYRSFELNVFGDKDPKLVVLEYALTNSLRVFLDDGLEWVISGGELGIEQWGLEAATKLKADYPKLQTAMMLPFSDFGNRWSENNQAHLAQLKLQVDFTASVSQQPYQNPSQLHQYQDFMLQHTDGALMVYDPEFPGKAKYQYDAILRYQEHHDYPFTQISMSDLEEAAQNYADSQQDF